MNRLYHVKVEGDSADSEPAHEVEHEDQQHDDLVTSAYEGRALEFAAETEPDRALDRLAVHAPRGDRLLLRGHRLVVLQVQLARLRHS